MIVAAIFDSGANVTLINESIKNKLGLETLDDNDLFSTASGQGIILGRVRVRITIGKLSNNNDIYVVRNLKHDMLLGLDSIKLFKLYMNSDFQVMQKVSEKESILIRAASISEYDNHNTFNELKLNLCEYNEILSNSIRKFNNNSSLKIEKSACGKKHELSEEQKNILQKLIYKYEIIFSKHKYDVGHIKFELCQIDLTNNVPINLRPYRCSDSVQKLIDDQVNKLLEHNLIRESKSAYAFPVTLASKKDEGDQTRLCIDIRQLNAITKKDKFPFPMINELMDRILNCYYLTKLDVRSSFWHIKIHPNDIHKTAFVTRDRHLEWLVMPFGFCNSPPVFQRAARKLIRNYQLNKFCDNYLDDFLIYSQSFEAHIDHLEKVFEAFR